MKLRSLFAGLVCAAFALGATAQPLAWDDPAIKDGECTPRPPALNFPAAIFNVAGSLPQGLRVYVPFGNATYYRWIHQKVNGGVPATSQAQILATKPIVAFPFLPGLPLWAIGRVELYDHHPVDKWYYLQALPNNPFGTDVTVNIVSPSPGSTPYGYGGVNIPTVTIWADLTALVEWHCFTSAAGSFPVFNVLSTLPTLTSQQLSSISAVLQNYGFQPSNFITIPY